MFWILGWLIYGLVVGLLVKAIYPGNNEPKGFLATVGIGVAGSFVGGAVNWILGMGGSPFQASGWIMGIIGGLVFCWVYMNYLREHVEK